MKIINLTGMPPDTRSDLMDAISDLDFSASSESWDATCKRIRDAISRVQNAERVRHR